MRSTWRIAAMSTKSTNSRNHFMGSSSLLEPVLINSLKWSRSIGIYKDKPITPCSQNTLWMEGFLFSSYVSMTLL